MLTCASIILISIYVVTLTSPRGNVYNRGDKPIFNCGSFRDTITSVQWLINETRFEDLNLTNVETEFSQQTRLGTLVFNNVCEKYNNTNIQCRVILSNGETADSRTSTFLVQGER